VHLAALAVVVVLAAGLRFANLRALGLANHYYAAAVASMQTSWRAFFFVAAEPGGSVSVDKPPVGLWLQAVSAHFLGVNTLALLLPQLLAGVCSVILLYHLVNRSFGATAGLLAALAMAVTPVAVATDRNNTMDSTLILTLLLAAWAFIVATEKGRLRHLLVGALAVGVAFDIKMLQAFLPLPAFYALYLLGAKERLGRKLGKLALASVLLAAVALSWAVVVDLTPADQRPYVGSSGDNSEMSLMVGYNGVNRLLGLMGGGGRPPGAMPGRGMPLVAGRPDGAIGGVLDIGTPGPQRLFTSPLSKEVSWLVPFSLFSCLLLMVGRWRLPVGPRQQAIVLWGGWMLTAGVFFSVAGFFHEYYLSMLAPPVAALVGVGVAELGRLRQQRPWLSVGLLLAAVGCTLWFQAYTARAFVAPVRWQPLVVALFVGGSGLLAGATLARRFDKLASAGACLVVATMFVTPGIWSGLTNAYPSQNQALPSAYDGTSAGATTPRGVQVNKALVDYLAARTQDVTYMMAVPSSMQGADYVLATGRPVLYVGGFNGSDEVITAEGLERMVCEGKLRHFYWSSGMAGGGSNSGISAWLTSRCTVVAGYGGVPPRGGAPGGGASGPGFGERLTLYECPCATASIQ
jgi:4-amino-4-deoxy-L-arabinose transferase-like glycosyltransferase